MKDLIHIVISDGELLVDKPRTEKGNDTNAYIDDANTWIAKTTRLIEDAYGKGEADIFMSNIGITITSGGPTRPNVLTRNVMIARLQRLNELMSRVDTISTQPDFNPRNFQLK